MEVGLYRAVTPGRFGGPIESKDLLANRVRFTPRTGPDGAALSSLGTEERMIVACIHARFDRSISNLLVQRDVVQLVLRDDLSMRKVERLRTHMAGRGDSGRRRPSGLGDLLRARRGADLRLERLLPALSA